MTLQLSGLITYNDLVNEIRLVNPTRPYAGTLGDADMRALANKPAGPISFSDFYGKSSYVPMTVNGVDVTASFSSAAGAGTAVCNPSVTVSGGSGGFTYVWSFTSNPDGCTLGSATSQSCSVSKGYSSSTIGSATATLQCAVTDNTSHTVTETGITASLEWSNGV